MAVDTRNRRASVLGFGLASLLVLPAPDATVDQADRQQTAYSYAGILAIPAEPETHPELVLDMVATRNVRLESVAVRSVGLDMPGIRSVVLQFGRLPEEVIE